MKHYTLGIHIGHDRSVSLVKNGKLIFHIAQERIDRIKHSPSPKIPFESINILLKKEDINIKNIFGVGINYTYISIENIIDELKEEFLEYYKLNDIEFYGVSHHLSHAISTYYTSNFEKSVIFIADGAGDIIGDRVEAESLYIGEKNKILLIEQRLQDLITTYVNRKNFYNYSFMNEIDKNKQISITRKYEQITYLLGFGLWQAGKTMGLAPYGKSMIDYEINYFNTNNIISFDLRFQDLLKELHDMKEKSKLTHYLFIKKEKYNIAKTIQVTMENIMLDTISRIYDKYPCENLSLAGGLFLNCVLNHKILKKTKFKNIHIIPASSDDGTSVGTAFFVYNKLFGNSIRNSNSLPYLGIKYTEKEILQTINSFDLKYIKLKKNKLSKYIAKQISNGKIVGVFRGRSEMGPRALCHRSILADPRKSKTKEHLNQYIKYREMFRPFAPVVLKEKQFKYFELLQDSPYMLLATKVKREFRKKLKAITHVDKTARVQSISKKDDDFVYSLLKSFEEITTFPILLNTSFNLSDEPIVESPYDAISTYLRSNIDLLVIEDYLVLKKGNSLKDYQINDR